MPLSRRELLAGGAAAAAVVLAGRAVPALARAQPRGIDFTSLDPGDGWPGFVCTGVANLRRAGGEGVLEAGSDVFPNDPRPVAFALDARFAHGSVTAVVSRIGAGAGVVVRRVSPRDYYAAIADTEQGVLVVVRRTGFDVVELARAVLGPVVAPVRLTLDADGTSLRATLVDALGRAVTASATDGHALLQRPGDPGVLATARTLFPSERNEALPALGNVHLLPYGVQEGQAFIESPAGQSVVGAIRERSTAAFREIVVEPREVFGLSVPSIVAATNGAPGSVRVATDVPARVAIEVSRRPDMRGARTVRAGTTGAYEAATARLAGGRPGRRLYWRARVRRRGRVAVGPVRSVRVLPRAGSPARALIAVGSCASQFGPMFDALAARRPDAFVWQGDLNYPDTHGPLAQTASAYAGIWRDFLANPRMAPLLERSAFVPVRDDHDYGVQDARADTIPAHALAPWDALMGARPYTRFSAGLLDVWVLDQRRFKSAPGAPDTEDKTLLGPAQRAWLLRALEASRAPFKLVCSPCTLAPARAQNPRDGNWSAGFTAERDLLLRHIADRVRGTTIFVTGDTHFTMVYDAEGLFEARACPLDIPTPNDITISEPNAAQQLRGLPGVTYADDQHGHVALASVRGAGRTATLELSLMRADGTTPYVKSFEQRIPRRRPRRHPAATIGDSSARSSAG